MALNAGSAFVSLFAKFEKHDFEQYDRAIVKARREKDVKTALKGDFDRRAFKQYEEELHKSRRLSDTRSKLKTHLGADFDPKAFNQYRRAVQENERATRIHERGLHSLAGSFKKAGAAAVAAGAAYASISGAKNAISLTEALAKATLMLHTSFGLSVRTASAWAAVAKSRDMDPTALHMGFTKLAKTIEGASTEFDNQRKKIGALGKSKEDLAKKQDLVSAGAGKQSAALMRLGITQDDVKRGQHDFEFLLGRVSSGFTNLRGGTERAALAQQIFGRGAKSLIPILRAGTGGLQDQLRMAKEYGVTFSGKTLNSVKDLIAAQREAKFATMGLQLAFGTSLAPQLAKLVPLFAKFVKGLRDGSGAGGQVRDVVMQVVDAVGQFFGQMKRHEGTGGDFRNGLHLVGKTLGWLLTTFKHATDGMLGFFSTVIRGEGAIASLVGKLHPGHDAFDEFAHKADVAADRIDKFRERLRPTGPKLDDLRDKTHGVTTSLSTFHQQTENLKFAKLRRELDDLGHGMVTSVGVGSDHAFHALDVNSQKAVKRAGARFASLQRAVDVAMLGINTSLNRELSTLGSSLKIDASFGGRSKGAGHAGGGWIGERGMVAPDMVHALLAPGEAVLNRHQQAVVEALLGQGFLDQLFARVQRPHYMATGGIAGMVGAASQLDHAHFPYRWGGGHQASPAPFGPMDCSGAVSYVLQHGGVDIPTMTSGQLAGSGTPGPGLATVFANPTHTFMRIGQRYFGTSGANPGGGAGWFPPPGAGYISRFAQRHFGSGDTAFPEFSVSVGGSGRLPAIARAALGISAGAVNRFLRKQVSGIGLGTGDVGDAGPGVTGRVSTFGPPTEPAGTTASGASSSLPGIAIFNRSTLGRDFQVSIGGHRARLRQTDLGPAPSTGRKIDVTGAGASRMGINPHHFPTDSIGTAMPFAVGGKVPPGGGADPAGAVPGLSSPRYSVYNYHKFWEWLRGRKVYTGSGYERVSRDVFEDMSAGPLNGAWDGLLKGWFRGGRRGDLSSKQRRVGGGPFRGGAGGWFRKYMHGDRYSAGGYVDGPIAFASGGHVPDPSPSKRKPTPNSHVNPTNRLIRSLRGLQTDRIGDWDAAMADVADQQKHYNIIEARYNITDEELIRDDGSLDSAAFTKKLNELADLLHMAQAIKHRLQQAHTIAHRVIKTYKTIVDALKGSLRHAPRKARGGIKARIDSYEERLTEWRGKIHDLETGDLPEAGTDVLQLKHELSEVQKVPAKAAADLEASRQSAHDDAGGDEGGGGDGGGSDASPDTGSNADAEAQSSQLVDQLRSVVASARANAAVLGAFASPGDIGSGGRNALAATGGGIDQLSAQTLATPQVPAGFQPQVTVVVNSLVAPTDPAVLRAIGDAAASGISYQPSRTPSSTNLGL